MSASPEHWPRTSILWMTAAHRSGPRVWRCLGSPKLKRKKNTKQQNWHFSHWFYQYMRFYNKHLKTLRQSCQNKWAPCSRAPRQWSENVFETGLDPETLRLPAQPTKVTPEASSNKKRIYVAIFDFPKISRMKLQCRTDPGPNLFARLANASWVGGALWKSHLTPVVKKRIWSIEDLADFGPAAFPTRVWGGRIVPEKAAEPWRLIGAAMS